MRKSSHPLNLRPKRIQPLVDILVAAFNLVAVVDDAGAVGGERGNEYLVWIGF